jgi:hypothetical protein
MRKPALLLLLLAARSSPSLAATPVPVAKLELAIDAARGKADAKTAQQIYELELTERLNPARLAHLLSDLPGPASRQALQAVADESQFLDLPAADISQKPAPNEDAQAQLWALTLDYASRTSHRLPNFFATRSTARFEDTPAEPPRDTRDTIKYKPLHEVGEDSVTVLYRDGHEFVDAAGKSRAGYDAADYQLSSAGEFGPILATVLADSGPGHNDSSGAGQFGAARSGVIQPSIIWSHWEQTPAGPLAVFRYAVAKQNSHYMVNFPNPRGDVQFVPAYHGEIGVNPADGSILRLTMVADLAPGDPGTRAGLLVEYGPDEIGGSTYICPLRSVALSLVWQMRLQKNQLTGDTMVRGPLQTRVNDVAFKDYHLFRAEMRILPDSEADPQSKPSAPAPPDL